MIIFWSSASTSRKQRYVREKILNRLALNQLFLVQCHEKQYFILKYGFSVAFYSETWQVPESDPRMPPRGRSARHFFDMMGHSRTRDVERPKLDSYLNGCARETSSSVGRPVINRFTSVSGFSTTRLFRTGYISGCWAPLLLSSPFSEN